MRVKATGYVRVLGVQDVVVYALISVWSLVRECGMC